MNRPGHRPRVWPEDREESVPVTRQALSIPSERTYITVEPDQTTESHIAGLRQKYVLVLALSVTQLKLRR